MTERDQQKARPGLLTPMLQVLNKTGNWRPRGNWQNEKGKTDKKEKL